MHEVQLQSTLVCSWITFFALAVKNTPSHGVQLHSATNALGDASKYQRQAWLVLAFSTTVSSRRYAQGQWLRLRCEEHKVHGATVALQEKALKDAGEEPEAMWPVLACSRSKK